MLRLSLIILLEIITPVVMVVSKYEDFIEEYRTKYQTIKKQRKLATENSPIVSLEQYKLSPNSMQVDFINNLKKIREMGEDKALLISATG